ncbi:Rossmann-like and DUF2520 domain-containing protein [Rubritalea tangerina]|uniref:Rossmann-like and DUF2520 domain-containing protein n=1 Tax=Rubritalea tangerina TaxID=430798 RepID=A0ABW4Z738_9BACT
MQTLNIIGAGKLGQSLARLWHAQQILEIGAILNRSEASSHRAIDHIGAGTLHTQLSSMPAAELWLLACPDDQIAHMAQTLAASKHIRQKDTVFHCSGALSSDLLDACAAQGALTASMHPIMSFAHPFTSISQLQGSYCGAEGSGYKRLQPLFEAIGCQCVEIHKEHKALYHSASVFACNYLTTLLETSKNLLETSGFSHTNANKLLEPIVRKTLDNFFRTDAETSLTGPISRGDVQCVTQHIQALQTHSPQINTLYKALAQATLPISEKQKMATPEQLSAIQHLVEQ